MKFSKGFGGRVERFEIVGGNYDAPTDSELFPRSFEGALKGSTFDENAAGIALDVVEAFGGAARNNVYICNREAIAVCFNQFCNFIVTLNGSNSSLRTK